MRQLTLYRDQRKPKPREADRICKSLPRRERHAAVPRSASVKKPANKDLAASVHQRLLNVARETGRPFNEVLQYFAMERLLYRLSCSPHVGSFVLKGALLFRVWDVPDSRATRDIDFLAFLDNSPESIASIFREVCAMDDDDGLLFDPDSVAARKIKEDADYEGLRVRFRGLLGKARITMQIDIGFGDKVHPDVVQAKYPVYSRSACSVTAHVSAGDRRRGKGRSHGASRQPE